ncbi:hypothetical protein BS50DRAFT_286632 [Corynespora cassiicola Philippines]|uniref:Proteophosphoglycan 5 n=1 Tax=Corynespora cassiicola Philippines TaxID=1448308 RepID=A0A2T2P255_CORCC|nr:hypothetical protein BS50DRAFT_286632 [Corynespora cassiicola Philippines]
MSSTQNTSSPRAPRGKHHHSKSATQTPPANNGNASQRRRRGNRAPNGHAHPHGDAQAAAAHKAAPLHDPAFSDSAVFSSEDVHLPKGPRNAKKHTNSQPASDRVFSPSAVATASLTDSELAPINHSTPVKVQGAYAGASFNASPAANKLPIPKFLSKSVPAKPRTGIPTPPPEDGSDSASSPTPSPPSPSRAPIPVPPRHEDSPLDMLFKADRAEKARNGNGSPASAAFNSPQPPSTNGRPNHVKHDSYSSLNTVFPIELDGEARNPRNSPPSASPQAFRSVTEPSKVPQVSNGAYPAASDPMQDLLNRLSISKNTVNSTPQPAEHAPSDPSSRHHTPSPFYDGRSPFRSASGPTTPVPAAQSSDFFYGNSKNLSPLFKQIQADSPRHNSGLRTEITADSPLMQQGGFAPVSPPQFQQDPNAVSRHYLDNVLNGPVSPRRGSVPHNQPYREPPNNRKPRTPGRRPFHPRPDSHPHATISGSPNGNVHSPPISMPKASTTMSFIPSSVQAKQHSVSTTPKQSDNSALEQDLKRLLNMSVAGDTTGVR